MKILTITHNDYITGVTYGMVEIIINQPIQKNARQHYAKKHQGNKLHNHYKYDIKTNKKIRQKIFKAIQKHDAGIIMINNAKQK